MEKLHFAKGRMILPLTGSSYELGKMKEAIDSDRGYAVSGDRMCGSLLFYSGCKRLCGTCKKISGK